ncbi:hypothetical protein I7I48_04772 [Histoplasma ohiense]|nr:hypothetical protein I7I48_04772 [Histoplasma ohiense (nom. inval.)]
MVKGGGRRGDVLQQPVHMLIQVSPASPQARFTIIVQLLRMDLRDKRIPCPNKGILWKQPLNARPPVITAYSLR